MVEVGEERSREFSAWWLEAGKSELRQLLYWVWDPIGISDEFPHAADEYDGYALEIATAVASDIPVSAVAALLVTIEQNQMGVTGRPPRATAERLRAWYKRSQERYAGTRRSSVSG